MKALIISEDETVYTSLNKTLTNAGYDTIIYKWLLKALDNIEEIRPDVIVVSSSEYPRHWKTLVQFVKSGIGGENVNIYLYEPNPISDEDKEKAEVLGITGYFESLEDFNIPKVGSSETIETVETCEDMTSTVEPMSEPVPQIEEIVPVPVDAVPEPMDADPESIDGVPEPMDGVPELVEGQDNTNSIINTGHFMFTHPESKKFISGKFFDYNGKTLSCSLYNIKDAETLKAESVIDRFSFFDSKVTRMCSVKIKDIVSVVPSNPIVIVEVIEIYEQN